MDTQAVGKAGWQLVHSDISISSIKLHEYHQLESADSPELGFTVHALFERNKKVGLKPERLTNHSERVTFCLHCYSIVSIGILTFVGKICPQLGKHSASFYLMY